MRALFVLDPHESKRLIGKAVARMKEVKRAVNKANILIFHGSTNIYVLEEILGVDLLNSLMNPSAFISGLVIKGTLCSTSGKEKPPIVFLKNGVITPPADTMSEMLCQFGPDSIIIKGANAIDNEGYAGALVAHPEGGSIGWSIGTILARGIPLIAPVGLEKLVPSVQKAVSMCGQLSLDYVQGKRVGMIPLTNAIVVSEIKAMKIITGLDAFHVASGGVSGSEGAVGLVVEGKKEAVHRAIEWVEKIKGEPALTFQKDLCETCVQASPGQKTDYESYSDVDFCRYRGLKEEKLPPYLRKS